MIQAELQKIAIRVYLMWMLLSEAAVAPLCRNGGQQVGESPFQKCHIPTQVRILVGDLVVDERQKRAFTAMRTGFSSPPECLTKRSSGTPICERSRVLSRTIGARIAALLITARALNSSHK